MSTFPELPGPPGPERPRPQTRLNGVAYEFPICHRCGAPVWALTWADVRHPILGELCRVFFALCHNETDTITIPMRVLRVGVGIKIEEAFIELELPEPQEVFRAGFGPGGSSKLLPGGE